MGVGRCQVDRWHLCRGSRSLLFDLFDPLLHLLHHLWKDSIEPLIVQVQVVSEELIAHLDADYEPSRRFYIHDPDGIEVELVEPPQS